ncbi:MAG: hypothetical protein HY744_10115 [Deltaproteobacteria bacterium]|nr:hypothetical protein [Deltaproteobacteria bacterium]
MKTRKTSIMAVSVALLSTGCAGSPARDRGASDDSPPPCSPREAPLAKVMSSGYAEEYSSCTVTTKAAFYSPDWGAMVGGEREGLVKWSALPPGEEPTATPLGVSGLKYMYLPKDQADVLFTLKKGQLVTVTGSARVFGAGQVMFFARQVTPAE